MKDFYKLLYGLLDSRKLSDMLRCGISEIMPVPDENCVIISKGPTYRDTRVKVSYFRRKKNLTEEYWNKLLSVLSSGTYKKILSESINDFSLSEELIEFLNYSYEIPREELALLNKQIKEIEISYYFEIIPLGFDDAVKLCEISMPQIIYIMLDPCISGLIETYSDALINFVDTAISNTRNLAVFHQLGCCSPWLEEIFDIAFRDVFGEAAGQCCRLSNHKSCDDYPTPAFLLKTYGDRQFELETNECSFDDSIQLLDSQGEEVRSGVKNHLYAWRNRVGALASTPQEINATRMIYVDSCYGYSFDINLFLEGKSLYNPSDSIVMPFEEIASQYKCDHLRVPFYMELFDLLRQMECWGLVFRGQTSEYFLNRSPELMEKLYGDEKAKEPSLASFALRNGDCFENHCTEWGLLIKEYLSLFIGCTEVSQTIGQMDVGNFFMFCLAVAQHYGLPTFGLDVSKSIATALFFSLFEYRPRIGVNGKSQYIRKESGESIIYLFKPKKHEIYDFSRFECFNEESHMFFRPIAQEASFAHASWGMARNSVAERLLFAIHFDVKDIDFDELNHLLESRYYPSLEVDNFFPENDPFICFLQSKYLSADRPMDSYPHVSKIMEYLKKYIYQLE